MQAAAGSTGGDLRAGSQILAKVQRVQKSEQDAAEGCGVYQTAVGSRTLTCQKELPLNSLTVSQIATQLGRQTAWPRAQGHPAVVSYLESDHLKPKAQAA